MPRELALLLVESGRKFTQEDPIGLAGGLNLYGFAGGDPVNSSDPFGLCEDCSSLAQRIYDAAQKKVNSTIASIALLGAEIVASLSPIADVFTLVTGKGVSGEDAGLGGRAIAAAFLVVGVAGQEFKLVDGMKLPVNKALDAAASFLGEGYRDMGKGRFLSADGLRQVRMGDSDILGLHGAGPHMNFETLVPNPAKPGKNMILEDLHIYLR